LEGKAQTERKLLEGQQGRNQICSPPQRNQRCSLRGGDGSENLLEGRDELELLPPDDEELPLPIPFRVGGVATEYGKSGRGGLQSSQGEYPASTASRSVISILLRR